VEVASARIGDPTISRAWTLLRASIRCAPVSHAFGSGFMKLAIQSLSDVSCCGRGCPQRRIFFEQLAEH
jgi:hypothetical protein